MIDLVPPTGAPADFLRTHERTSCGNTPLLAIVIVSFDGRELLRKCLASLQRYPLTVGDSEVHVVDNASRDDTTRMVRNAFPSVVLHELESNRGFAAANNVVLEQLRSPYVLLLNPDTEACPGALDHMLQVMILNQHVGISGCRLVRKDGSFDHAAKRSFPTPLAAIAHFAKLGRRGSASPRLAQYRSPDVDERGVGPVDAVNGAFMLVRRQAMQDVGLLDSGYWMYGEDLDWCYRFQQRGWRVIYDGRVKFVHVKGGSAGTYRRVRQNFAFHHAMARFYRKFYAGRRPVIDALVISGITLKFVFSVCHNNVARAVRASQGRESG